MIHIRNMFRISALMVISIAPYMYAAIPLNLFNAESAYFLPEFPVDRCFELNVTLEQGLRFQAYQDGFKECEKSQNALQLWQNTQDGLSMIRGFDSSTPIGQFAARLNMVGGDKKRAHFRPYGSFKSDALFFTARCRLPYDFSVICTVPLYTMSLGAVSWQSLSEHSGIEDELVDIFLLNDFFETVRFFGEGLDVLNGWKRSGIGDVVMRIAWDKHFPQWRKPVLRDVRLDTYVGLALPTGQKSDINALFSMPFGNEGGASLLFGGGIELTWGRYFKGALHVDLSKTLGVRRVWRIKNFYDQTDLLFLAKAHARKTFGMTQRYKIQGEFGNCLPGFTLRCAYYHVKHNRDRYALYDSPYSENIANSALSLQEWTTHDFVISSEFDCGCVLRRNMVVAPRLNAFYKIPIKARNALASPTICVGLTLDF
jgi:hypothetical protein